MNHRPSNPGAAAPRRRLRVVGSALAAGVLSIALLGAGALSEAEAGPDAGAAAEAARGAFAAQAVDGKKVYNTVCAACHQASGEGVPGMFPPVAGSEWVTGDKGRLVRIILHGVTGEIEVAGETYSSSMPPWGGALKDAEVAAVATYMRSAWGNKASPVTAAEVAAIRKATADRKKPWTAKELVLSTAPKK